MKKLSEELREASADAEIPPYDAGNRWALGQWADRAAALEAKVKEKDRDFRIAREQRNVAEDKVRALEAEVAHQTWLLSVARSENAAFASYMAASDERDALAAENAALRTRIARVRDWAAEFRYFDILAIVDDTAPEGEGES